MWRLPVRRDNQLAAVPFQAGTQTGIPAHRGVGDGINLGVGSTGGHITYEHDRMHHAARGAFDHETARAGTTFPRDAAYGVAGLIFTQTRKSEGRPSPATRT